MPGLDDPYQYHLTLEWNSGMECFDSGILYLLLLLLLLLFPSFSGELTQETTGVLFTGDFKDGKFHGSGEVHWFSDRDTRKKYIGEFKNHTMDGHGEMK